MTKNNKINFILNVIFFSIFKQYFLVNVDSENFYVWSHPICSVKLASEPFDLDNFNESIHLTNASIQQKYYNKNCHPDLPSHHM